MLSQQLSSLHRAPSLLRSKPAGNGLHTCNLYYRKTNLSLKLPVPQSTLLRPCCKPGYTGPKLFLGLGLRGAASSVSGRPGSQTPQHAATNIKEEVGNAASEFAKSIAGANLPVDNVKPVNSTFLGITSAVASAVPKPVFIFGLAGGLPYIATSGTTVYLARQAGLAAAGHTVGIDPGVALTILDQALSLQVTYGAVMLSFLGALHWGMEFSGFGGQKGYSRLFLGAVPVVYGWSTLALDPTQALIAQWVGFTGLWWADLKATNAGWAPKWYSQYRFYLSILVGTCIIGSLAGTSYFGPVAGHGLLTHDLDLIRAERKKHEFERSGKIGGEIEAIPAAESADNYVQLKRKVKEAEKNSK